jgi:GT2 family glycosyltransferase
MYISIVIPAYNLLEDCIKSLAPDVQQPDCEYELIVSDDKRNSGTKQFLEEKYPWAKWSEGPHRGVSANRNNGVKHAKGDWIVFIDNDTIPDKNLIQNYIHAIKDNHNILVFEGCVKPDRPKRHFLEEAPINETGGAFWTCNVMIQKDYFVSTLYGFDESFFLYGEDVDIRERIKKTNQPILFVKNAIVIHPWRIQKDKVEFTKQQMTAVRQLHVKHPHLKQKPSFINNVKNELRFYIKDVLFKIIPYRGRGLFKYIQAHISSNKVYRQSKLDYENNEEGWLRFY